MPETPSLKDFRRIVVKVGSSLPADAQAGAPKRDWLDSLAGRIADGSLRVPVQATFPIEEIKPALALANAYHRTGKVLVTPNGKVG